VVGFHRAATSRPPILIKPLKFVYVKRTTVAIEVSETTWNLLGIASPVLHFQANLLFPYVSTPSGRLAGTL